MALKRPLVSALDFDSKPICSPNRNVSWIGYCMYSSSTILVFTMGDGVNGFTLDPQIGEFVMTHPNIQVPKRGKVRDVDGDGENAHTRARMCCVVCSSMCPAHFVDTYVRETDAKSRQAGVDPRHCLWRKLPSPAVFEHPSRSAHCRSSCRTSFGPVRLLPRLIAEPSLQELPFRRSHALLSPCAPLWCCQIYSFNEANSPDWPENLQNYVMDLKNVSRE